MRFAQHCLASICVALAALTSRASDWYVDAAAGNNSNSGTAPTAAWRTITYALSHIPLGGLQRVYVAAGLYDTALGETFPIQVREARQLIGAGPNLTHIQAPGSYGVIILDFSVTPLTQVSGMSITAYCPLSFDLFMTSSPEVRDLVLIATGFVGVFVNGDNGFGFGGGALTPRLERVRAQGPSGILILGGDITAIDCVFANSAVGVSVSTFSFTASGTFTRCRIEGNGTGVYARAGFDMHGGAGDYSLRFSECSISGNSGDGVLATRESPGINGSVTLQGCTIADNAAAGIGTTDPTLPTYVPPDLTVRDSILFGNGDDLSLGGPPTLVTNCDIGDGDFAGTNGNFAADPLFVNPATSDWRLRWNSPCTDVPGLPASTATLDLARNPRVTDGNLDTQEVRDLGAFEFAPLFRQGTGAIGTQLVLECWGEVGATTTVYFSRLPLAATPMGTAFGQFDLDPSHYGFFKSSGVGQSTPVSVTRLIPHALALVGRTFSFQALTSSSSAPSGFAHTNPVQFTVVP
jgi:hypothetical protein